MLNQQKSWAESGNGKKSYPTQRKLETIKILGFDWDVFECAEGDEELGKSCGQCNYRKMKILIASPKTMGKDMWVQTYIHEFCHALSFFVGYYYDKSGRDGNVKGLGCGETFANCMAYGINSVFARSKDGMKLVPEEKMRKFRILNNTWAVKFEESGKMPPHMEDCVCNSLDFCKHEIVIFKGLSAEARTYAFLHSVVHIILSYIGRSDLVDEECLVAGFTNAIWPLFKFRDEIFLAK